MTLVIQRRWSDTVRTLHRTANSKEFEFAQTRDKICMTNVNIFIFAHSELPSPAQDTTVVIDWEGVLMMGGLAWIASAIVLAQDGEVSAASIRDKAAALSDPEFRNSAASLFASWQALADSEDPPAEIFEKAVLDRFVSLGTVEILQGLIHRANAAGPHSDAIENAIERAAAAPLAESGFAGSRRSAIVVASIRMADDARARRYLAQGPDVLLRVLDCRDKAKKREFDAVLAAQSYAGLGVGPIAKDELACRTARSLLVSSAALAVSHFEGEIENWVMSTASISGGPDFWRAVLAEILLRPSAKSTGRALELARVMEVHLRDKELQARTCLALAEYKGRPGKEPPPSVMWRIGLFKKAFETAASDELRARAVKAIVEEHVKTHQFDAALEAVNAGLERINDGKLRTELASLIGQINEKKSKQAELAAVMEKEQKRQGLEGRLKAMRELLEEYKKSGRSEEDIRIAEEEIRKAQEELDALK